MKFNVEWLLKEKLIARVPASKQKAEESIIAAHSWIKEAENNLKNKSFKSCVLTSYLGMFHAGRAILFFDGFREKSHFAIARYLEEMYGRKNKLEKKWIELLDYYRDLRNQDQYRTSFVVEKEEAKRSLESAKKFIERIEKLFKEKLS